MSAHDGQRQSDYERVGGGPAVSSVVTRFYDLVLADPQVAPFFTGVDMAALKRHQVLLISQVMGGPARLGIGPNDFAAVVAHLVTALQEASVPDEIIGRVGAALEATEADIVSTTAH